MVNIYNFITICYTSNTYESLYKIYITIAKGITIGMSQADLEAILSGTEFEKDDSSSSYIYYKIMPASSSLDRYEIYVNKESGNINKIVSEYSNYYYLCINKHKNGL